MKPFDQLTYEDAVNLFGTERRSKTAQTARKFFDGDHWQKGDGYIGQKPIPSYERYKETMDDLEGGFASENVIGEVAEIHVGGIMGQTPLWWFLRGKDRVAADDPLSESLTPWWDERDGLAVMSEAVETAVLEGVAVLRFYFPQGLLGDGSTITKPADISAALKYFYCEVLTADRAGVFTDEKTKKQIGVYLYEEAETDADDAPKIKKAELCYLNDKNQTVLRRVVDKGSVSEDFGPYNLGGRLFLHEVSRRALVTDSVIQLQKLVNLAHTKMGRNVNLAGDRTTDVINAQTPTKAKKEGDAATGQTREVGREPAAYRRTPGAVNYVWGAPFYDANGKIAGYTSPMINVTEPVDIGTFVGTRDHYYAAILGQCFMRHVLISGDATVSGRSREQARKEYERSLQKTKGPMDAAGRWKLETAVRMAAVLSGKESEVKDLRAYFDCQIERVERSAQERQEDRADVETGAMSVETLMTRNGLEDTSSELEKIKQERRDGIGVPARRVAAVPVQGEDNPPLAA
ncbi:MAG TPA: hypothetical protein VD835_19635 [Pyrinomonadaceae bacterium]|nr:hypothetical protein [Pyrinomonadaceae bacterium]